MTNARAKTGVPATKATTTNDKAAPAVGAKASAEATRSELRKTEGYEAQAALLAPGNDGGPKAGPSGGAPVVAKGAQATPLETLLTEALDFGQVSDKLVTELAARRDALSDAEDALLMKLGARLSGDPKTLDKLWRALGLEEVKGGRTFSSEERALLLKEFLRLPASHRSGPHLQKIMAFSSSAFLEQGKRLTMSSLETYKAALTKKGPEELAAYKGAGLGTPQALFTKGYRHEVGHSLDFRDHADTSFHKGGGWSRPSGAELVKSLPVAKPVKGAEALAARLTALADTLATGATDATAAVAELEALATTKPLLEWLEAQDLFKMMKGSRDLNNATGRLRKGGVEYMFHGKMKTAFSVDMKKAFLDKWGAFETPRFSDREWAAELYQEWFATETPGTGTIAKGFTGEPKAWLEKLASDPDVKKPEGKTDGGGK